MVQGSHHIHHFGDLSVDLEARQARVGATSVELEPRLFDLLAFLCNRGKEVASKDELLGQVWGGRVVTDAAIAQAVAKLRRQLKAAGLDDNAITTLHGKGYRWDLPEQAAPADPPSAVAPVKKDSPATVRRWHWVTGALVLMVGLVISFRPDDFNDRSATLAVAPFAIAAEADLDWAELGLAALLAESLEARTPIKVISASRVRSSLNTLGIAADASPAEKLAALQRMVGADHLLLADVGRSDSGFRVSYQLASANGIVAQGELEGDRLDTLSYGLTRELADDIDVAYEAGIPVKKISSDDFVNEAFARGLQALLGGDAASARSYFESALASDPNLHWARYELGNALSLLGEWELAGAAYNQVMDSAEASSDLNLAGVSSSGLGTLAWRNGDLTLAERYYVQARDWFDQVGNQANLASAFGNLGILADNQQRWDEARDLYNRALTLYRNEGERFGESAVYSNLAVIERKLGRLDAAESLQQRAIDIQTAAGLRQMLVFSFSHAGKISAALGKWTDGEAQLREALALAEQLKDPLGAAEARSAIAEMLIDQGRLREAMEMLYEALDVYRELENPAGEARARLILSQLMQLSGDSAGALEEATAAANLFQDLNDQQLQVQALLAWAHSAQAEDMQREAESLVGKALTLAQELGDQQTLALVELSRAEVSLAQGMDPRSIYETALGYARQAGDRRTEALVALDFAEYLIEQPGADESADRLESLLGVAEAWQPEYHRALYLRGCYLESVGQNGRAFDYIERAKGAAGETWRADQEARLVGLRSG